jgi:hypothetical protein
LQDSIALQKDIFKFNPTNEGLGVKTINILLCGGVGAGKSSIVSTVDSLFQGRISRRAPHGQGTGSLTCKLRKYKFTDPDTKKPVHWQLWDSMGRGSNEYKKGELGFILDGNLPNGCKLDDKISMKTAGFNKQPSVEDEVHCVCLVVPCDAATDDSYMEQLREMRQFARERGEREKPLPSVLSLDMYTASQWYMSSCFSSKGMRCSCIHCKFLVAYLLYMPCY